MWMRASCQLTDHVYQLTTAASSHVLIAGERFALVDSGIASTAGQLIAEIRRFLPAGGALSTVLLTHSHFDHVSGLAELRREFPRLQVIGSPLTEANLQPPDVALNYCEKNAACAAAFESSLALEAEDLRTAFRLERVVRDGDSINLGAGVEVKVAAAAGHSDDCTAYFVKPDGVLAGAESVGGYFGRDKYAPCFLYDLEQYLATIDKFLALDVKVLSLPHSGALSGELAKKVLLECREQPQRFAKNVRERLEGGAIREEVFFDILNEWAVEGLSPEGPFIEAQKECVRRMIELVLAE